jgi:hypothetical protein
MPTSYNLSEAAPTDAAAIAFIFAQSWVSPFSRLQWGHVDPRAFAKDMEPHIKDQIGRPNSRFMVMRYSDPAEVGKEEVVAVAHWVLPEKEKEAGMREESAEEKMEKEVFEDEVFRKQISDSCNKDLIMDFRIALRRLRESVLAGEKHYRM